MSKPAAIHFEAKLYALRKSKDGLVLSFVVHPSDIPKEIITADIGEQYVVACAPYVETNPGSVKADERGLQAPALPQKGQAAGPKSEGERALIRCALLCKETRFQFWASAQVGNATFVNAAQFVRTRCGIPSRSRIATDEAVLRRWLQLETKYLQDTDQLAEVRG